jgi:uncharacterized protein
MLQVDLRELARGPVETRGELPGTDPVFAGLEFLPADPVRVSGRIQSVGEGQFFWEAKLVTRVAGECRRCLKPVSADVVTQVAALFSQEAGAADDPETYAVAPDAGVVDLTPAVREELFLSIPRYLECRADCRGLCPRCGKDLNAGPCGCAPDAVDPRWQALAALKGKFRD